MINPVPIASHPSAPNLTPAELFKLLADETRLICALLIFEHGELCVCELVAALSTSQPKISRHLAQMRRAGLLQDQRREQWVFYQLHTELPPWVEKILRDTAEAQGTFLQPYRSRLRPAISNAPRCGPVMVNSV